MEPGRLRVRFHGVRGSMPNPDPAVAGYGGDTLCIEIETRTSSHRLLIDAGTGIRNVHTSTSTTSPDCRSSHRSTSRNT